MMEDKETKEAPPSSGNIYPKDRKEAEKFVAGIITSLHSDNTRPKLLKQLTNPAIPASARIGNAVAQVMTAMVSRVEDQAQRKPSMDFLLKSINMAVKEVSKMAELTGAKVTPEDRKEAAGIAGGLIDQGMQSKGQGQQGPPQPQGQPQGPMQANAPAQPQQPIQGPAQQSQPSAGVLGGMI